MKFDFRRSTLVRSAVRNRPAVPLPYFGSATLVFRLAPQEVAGRLRIPARRRGCARHGVNHPPRVRRSEDICAPLGFRSLYGLGVSTSAFGAVCRRWRSGMKTSVVVALMLTFGGPSADAAPGGFSDFRPLSLEELYAKRMRFAQGEPIISIGVMEGQALVVARSKSPVRLMFDERRVPKTIYGPPGSRYIFKVERARPAELRHWVIVGDHGYGDILAAEKEKDRWRSEGYEAKTFVTGTIVALKGNVLDTRRRLVGIGGFARRREARALSEQLFRERSLRTVLREEMVRLPQGRIVVHNRRMRRLHTAQNVVYFGTVEGGRTTVENVEHSRGYKRHGREHREYWDHIYIVVDKQGKLTVVNSVGAERLLAGLVPSEIFAKAPLEALKAQAVTARGEVFSKLGHRHFSDPYHLCTEQHCQVYAGARKERPTTDKAVAETRGLLAVRPRSKKSAPLDLVDSVYSSTCGGFTEDNEVVWDTPPSASLRARLDGNPRDPALAPFRNGLNEQNIRAWLEAYPPTYGARSTFVRAKKFRWQKSFNTVQLDAIGARQGVGVMTDMKILGRGRGGRVTGLRLVGTSGSSDVLRELPIRRLFGNLNSGMFVLDLEKSRDGTLAGVTFTGGGWGHGVGMCQIGAIGRAEAGQSFRQILGHYYNGAVVERLY